MIELAKVVRELRRELTDAIEAAEDAKLRFELGPVELETAVTVEERGTATGEVRFWVVGLGAEAQTARTGVQRITLTLQPRVAGSDAIPWVSGEESALER
ncbi:trypco2 family protein [Spongiactinospora sp. TRM90649]|uniref:trypco2 family protein n=1 Tax=Spongiactinospora sp. TRM90649 TaxID=3031114 RepID=UPI0023F6D1D7|nr:trypco2 family protein [Spongiactinospora sp. TRM90649]MDF5752798.1 hypothetical protein [Spongiactinospora sp. TRM90649]